MFNFNAEPPAWAYDEYGRLTVEYEVAAERAAEARADHYWEEW